MPAFQILKEKLHGGVVLLSVKGFLDAHTFEELEKTINDIFEEVTLSREFPSFLTLPAYARYLTEAREKATVEELSAA